ncbi:collagen alpha-1(I) chain-like [Panthera pardus]|uniref:Collagen alpha-1(I) chain-like n=1 Tax=Panthera pardus TaxID=9691 RepID=A0A9V1FUB6_PANPR|nr:collagen alpha-1(I) chain-like [Panthera pardus]XP_019309460.1 collagen alpha-1(I) chain-like [Panthera pardus]
MRRHQSRPSLQRSEPPEEKKGFAPKAPVRGLSSGNLAAPLSWHRVGAELWSHLNPIRGPARLGQAGPELVAAVRACGRPRTPAPKWGAPIRPAGTEGTPDRHLPPPPRSGPLRPGAAGAEGGGRLAGGRGLLGEQGVEQGGRPVQGRARVRQLPGEPGALRGRGLRAAGGHRQEGAPWSPQLVQGHRQRAHPVKEPAGDHLQGLARLRPQVAAAALWGGGSGLAAVLAASAVRGPHGRSAPGPPALVAPRRVGGTCAGEQRRAVSVSAQARGDRLPRSPPPLPGLDYPAPTGHPTHCAPAPLTLAAPSRIWWEPVPRLARLPPSPGAL